MAHVSRRLAWVRCLTPIRTERLGDDQWPAWLTACYQLTPHLQRFGDASALLDLGPCTAAEAATVVQALITRLGRQQITLRAAIAPSGVLAQLALIDLLRQSAPAPLIVLAREQTADLLRRLPIAALTRLQFADQTVIVTPGALAQAVSRLEGYGARTLLHLTRLDENDLRRQFGARLGALLAIIARGTDPVPLQPTPAPLRLRFRLRLSAPITVDRLLLGLPSFTCEVSSRLARRGLHGYTLELSLRWETGIVERITSITRTLSQPISDGRALAETLERMLTAQLQLQTNSHASAHANTDPRVHDAIEDVHLTVSRLMPRYPAQHPFWPQRARRLAATQEIADVLARRHGKPLLLQSVLTAPDAIFDQDRSRLTPLHADVADVAEGLGHRARPAADVADAPDTSDEIPHGIHWW